MVREIENAGISMIWADNTSEHAEAVRKYISQLSQGQSALGDPVFDKLRGFVSRPLPSIHNPILRIERKLFGYLPVPDDFDAETGRHGDQIQYVLWSVQNFVTSW